MSKEKEDHGRYEPPIMTILELELFNVWGIDFLVTFVSLPGMKYIFIAVEYVSEWVEVVSLPNNEGKSFIVFF